MSRWPGGDRYRLVLGERTTRPQAAGAGAALLGVGLTAATSV